MMSYQCLSFRDALGPGRAFAGVAVSHGANNSTAFLLIPAAGWL